MGYIEDRYAASNADPYFVSWKLIKTVFGCVDCVMYVVYKIFVFILHYLHII